MNNPYRKIMPRTQRGSTVTAGAFNEKGELNASSVKDAITQLGNVIRSIENQHSMRASIEANAQVSNERRQILVQAMNDKSGNTLQVLGEALTADILETTNREGFARRLLMYKELGQGDINEIVVKMKNVIAYSAVSPSQVRTNEVRERRMIAPEFNINCKILVDTKELARSTSDILEEKYEEGLEQTMTVEDRIWKKLADKAAVVRNTQQNFSMFTPAVFARMLQQLQHWGLPPVSCIMSSSLWQDVMANGDFTSVFDPVTQWELLQEGMLGSLYGVTIISDFYRNPNMKVLEDGEIYVVSAPIHHGAITVRGTLTTEPINLFPLGEAKKGWFLDQITSMTIGNAASVVRGRRA